MYKSYKKVIKYLFLAPLLMAFQCDEDFESTIKTNNHTVTITPQLTFSLNDTIWIEGKVSSKALDVAINDSIFNENPQGDIFSIFKFVEPTEHSNCKDAIDRFELIFDVGEYSFLSSCENSQITAYEVLDNDMLFYTYRIGLRPKFTGDYVISWLDSKIQNQLKNKFIAENYPIQNHPNQIGFNRCDMVSWLDIDESTKEYFFKVE